MSAISKTCTSPGESGRQTTGGIFFKRMITSFDAFKTERNRQKQYKNLIISRSKKRFVCLFMTDNFSECSLSVIVENKPTLCSPLALSAFKNDISVPLFKILHPNNGLRSYTQFDDTVRLAMNYDIPIDKTIQNVVTLLQAYQPVSTPRRKMLRETFDKVQTLQQKNVFLLVDEVDSPECIGMQSFFRPLYRRPSWLTNRCSL
ncbi:hypothetical protein FHG87_017171, partial [Trinorchestia longiramus]